LDGTGYGVKGARDVFTRGKSRHAFARILAQKGEARAVFEQLPEGSGKSGDIGTGENVSRDTGADKIEAAADAITQ